MICQHFWKQRNFYKNITFWNWLKQNVLVMWLSKKLALWLELFPPRPKAPGPDGLTEEVKRSRNKSSQIDTDSSRQQKKIGTSWEVRWLRLCTPNAGGTGWSLIGDWDVTCWATWPTKKEERDSSPACPPGEMEESGPCKKGGRRSLWCSLGSRVGMGGARAW